jgi:GNAT superfamily N-acetyltransferase
MGGLAVRRAQLDDLPVIVELRLALLREYEDNPLYGNLQPDAPARALSLFRAQLNSASEVMFLAETSARIVGVIRCVDTPSSPLFLPERYCYISSVYVEPLHRQQGVLRAMMEAVEAWCAERNLTEMRLHNGAGASRAEQAWEALGFDVVEQVRRRVVPAFAVATINRDRAEVP